MDELPALLADAVGDATALATLDIGGGDVVAVTPAETHVYRADGLLSDESVETYGHDVEQVTVDRGRRKHTVVLSGLESSERLTVPAKVADRVVEAMLEGVLRTRGVVEPDESVVEQFRFRELTIVVTDRRLLKHVGGAVWNDEFEAFPYDELTRLDFEEGSVNTQIVVQAGDRGERVKVPNDHAARVRDEVQSAVFEYHSVSSLGGLRSALAPDDGPEADEPGADDAGEADADEGTDDPGDAEAGDGERSAASVDGADEDGFVSAGWSPPADQDITGPRGRVDLSSGGRSDDGAGASSGARAEGATVAGTDDAGGSGRADDRGASAAGDDGAVAERVAALEARVDYQTELLERQQQTIEQLVEELRRGR